MSGQGVGVVTETSEAKIDDAQEFASPVNNETDPHVTVEVPRGQEHGVFEACILIWK